VVTGWAKYQEPDRTNAMRKKKLRANKGRKNHTAGTTRYEGGNGGTRHATETLTLTETPTKTEPQLQNPPQPTAVVVHANGNGGGHWNGAIVLDAWLKRFPIASQGLSAKERSKYGAVCKRLAEQHSKDEVAAAFLGIEKLYPHSEGEPWDPLTLQKKFGLALAAMGDHPKLKAQRDKDALLDEIQRRTR